MEFHFDLENPLPTSTDNFPLLFHTETDHMPSKAYLQTLSNLSTRHQILSLILHFSHNFDPFSSYLAINYMDRFLSTQSIPDGKPWIFKLVAISCISLALKMMRKTEFSVSDFQDCGVILDSLSLERMEMLILGALKWRMRSINPFSFIKFFISFFEFKDQISTQALKDKATELIFKAHNDIKLLQFKPSIIAASALLCAADELFPVQLPFFRNSISTCEYVNKENLFYCYNAMQEVAAIDGYESVLNAASSSCTPTNVLDVQCFNSSTSENGEIRDLKRRKLGDLAN
ncbi:G1/S-specific cyclin D [Handroanthus impetiginosus]|uniref:G1/S-specific cyclin D n=1 Tax=Handroanthus impetiginosus TaxID=429701 RepID=A0A2G9GAT7_9LAMI|nr:G1/S-specific cyclin D [Handroanthus impetiginosus]